MSEEKDAPAVEGKQTDSPEVNKVVEKKTVEDKNIGDALETNEAKERMVPESALLKYKSQSKESAKALKALQESIDSGDSKSEVTKGIKAIADEHNIDEKFLKDFAEAVRSEAEADIDSRIDSKLKPMSESAKADKTNKLFEQGYKESLEAMPEFKDIVNKEVIKSLVLNPSNKNKTFKNVIEEAYGHLVEGKKTLEKTGSRIDKTDGSIDYKKARKDPKYFNEVMADPALKKKYNEGLTNRIGL